MMAVFLLEDDEIGGVPRSAGELVIVPDDYDTDNIARIVNRQVEQANRKQAEQARARIGERKKEKRFHAGLQQLRTILQTDYPQFWNKLSNRSAFLDRIIDEMREDVSILQHALADPQWFVDEVTKRFTSGRN